MQTPIISVSGLRGVLGQSLSPEIVSRYVAAFVEQLPEGTVLIARDGRPSGIPIAEIVRGTITLLGRSVFDARIAATPTVGVLVRELKCQGAVQISASHNPPCYNGLKLMGPDGRVISAEQGEHVKAAYDRGLLTWAPFDEIGTATCCEDTTSAHLELVLKTVDAAAIRKKKFKVLLDSNAGAGSVLGVKLLEALGCRLVLIGGTPDGNFLHPAEPTEDNLGSIASQVQSSSADIAFCQDPDADRLAVIDEQGRYIGEEATLALCLRNVLPRTKGPVVINGATSRMNEDIAAQFDCAIFRSAVGEANVTEEMIRRKAVFGGEGNGGPIDPRVGYIRDSFVGMANILQLMTTEKLPISKLADQLPKYEIIKQKVEVADESIVSGFERLKEHFADAAVSESDGLRFSWENRWLIARVSNTEPIVRVIAESRSAEESQQMCESAIRQLRAS